jgi:hypothetical protein
MKKRLWRVREPAVVERFETHIDRSSHHHRWTGSRDPRTGTGQFRLNGKLRSAQRAAWELGVGPLPAGVRVRACLDDPSCVRVEHLAIETSRRDIASTSAATDRLGEHMTVSTAFPLYLAHLQLEGRAESTITVYRSIYRRWIDPVVGKVAVNALSDVHSAAVDDHMAAAVPSAAAVARSVLHGMADWSADEDL